MCGGGYITDINQIPNYTLIELYVNDKKIHEDIGPIKIIKRKEDFVIYAMNEMQFLKLISEQTIQHIITQTMQLIPVKTREHITKQTLQQIIAQPRKQTTEQILKLIYEKPQIQIKAQPQKQTIQTILDLIPKETKKQIIEQYQKQTMEQPQKQTMKQMLNLIPPESLKQIEAKTWEQIIEQIINDNYTIYFTLNSDGTILADDKPTIFKMKLLPDLPEPEPEFNNEYFKTIA
jgi:hypothetical protein